MARTERQLFRGSAIAGTLFIIVIMFEAMELQAVSVSS
jgi:hypothetical protein